MEERINVAEILKHCPKGMELDCITYNGVATLGEVTNNIYYPISINISCNNENICVVLTEYGQTAPTMFNKCVIFPKGKTTWEGFVPPCKFKAGDVLVSQAGNMVLFSHIDSNNFVYYHCIIPTYGSFRVEKNTSAGVGAYYECVLANEQQRQKMYDQIKCSGYKYNQQINKLEKLIEPEQKFKEGDILYTVTGEGRYYLCIVDCIIGGILYTKASCSCSGHFLCTCEEQTDIHKLLVMRFATEEEKQILFDAIKSNGYKWNAETRTLEKFIELKFKDGDVISVIISKNLWYGIYQKEINKQLYCHVSYSTATKTIYTNLNKNGTCSINSISEVRLATEAEKQKFFDAIKEDGYKWNSETKTLEKLIEPKFKDGDVVISSLGNIHILKNRSTSYIYVDFAHNSNGSLCKSLTTCVNAIRLATEEEKAKLFKAIKDNGYKWNEETKTLENLIIPKFDISTLKPFDKVLVRGNVGQKWIIDFFGFMDKNKGLPFVCVGQYVIQCIPYENNEHLCGTTNDCDEYYKTWK